MVVVDHDTRRLVWAAPGRNSATVREFFDLLGPDRCAAITHVSADGADFIDTIVAQMCPGATRVADPFHVVKWATDALDEVRRGAWNDARGLARTEPKRGGGRPPADAPPRPGSERAKALKGARYWLWILAPKSVKLWVAGTAANGGCQDIGTRHRLPPIPTVLRTSGGEQSPSVILCKARPY